MRSLWGSFLLFLVYQAEHNSNAFGEKFFGSEFQNGNDWHQL
jgi:hypothetical protein